jgi:hypothetical protein
VARAAQAVLALLELLVVLGVLLALAPSAHQEVQAVLVVLAPTAQVALGHRVVSGHQGSMASMEVTALQALQELLGPQAAAVLLVHQEVLELSVATVVEVVQRLL